jgi:hypothetical protein
MFESFVGIKLVVIGLDCCILDCLQCRADSRSKELGFQVGCFKICNEAMELCWEDKQGKEIAFLPVDAMGRTVGRVFGAADVVKVHKALKIVEVSLDALEDCVDGLVVMLALVPATKDGLVVAPEAEVEVGAVKSVEGKELNTDCLCPLNVALIALPSRDETPSPPLGAKNDPNSCSRAGVQVSTDISHLYWLHDWTLEARL